MRYLAALLLSLVSGSLAYAAQNEGPGRETVIAFAANGGLRNWQAGPPKSGVLYVRDRTERWYRVQLTRPCVTDRALDTLTYSTNVDGQFDRFSRVGVARYPGRTCGVASITTSLPPAGQPGAPKH